MTDDLFLKLSYFGTAAMSLLLAVVVYLVLRGGLARLTVETLSVAGARFMGRLFLIGMLISSFAGFLSVGMTGCDHDQYEEIVSDRAYVLERVREQASNAMEYTADGLLVSSVVVTFLLLKRRDSRKPRRE